MSIVVQKRKQNSVRVITLFRVFLWWGTEVVRQVMTYRKPKARIIHLLRSESVFPVSKWIFTKEETYCLVSDRARKGVDIYALNRNSRN